MVSAVISRLVILFVGTLYPAYGSYKAIRSRDPRQYVNWIMYWICFALFTFFETFSDILLAFCVPFYYELKIVFLAWLLCPATKGSSILYRNFVHPRLLRHEREIDDMIATAKSNSLTAVYHLGSRGAQYASHLLAQTAIKGQQIILQQLHRSYSQGDVSTMLAVPALLSSAPASAAGGSLSSSTISVDPLLLNGAANVGVNCAARTLRRQVESKHVAGDLLFSEDEEGDDEQFFVLNRGMHEDIVEIVEDDSTDFVDYVQELGGGPTTAMTQSSAFAKSQSTTSAAQQSRPSPKKRGVDLHYNDDSMTEWSSGQPTKGKAAKQSRKRLANVGRRATRATTRASQDNKD